MTTYFINDKIVQIKRFPDFTVFSVNDIVTINGIIGKNYKIINFFVEDNKMCAELDSGLSPHLDQIEALNKSLSNQ